MRITNHANIGNDKLACGARIDRAHWIKLTSKDVGQINCGRCIRTSAYREATRSGIDVLADMLSLDGGKTPAKITNAVTLPSGKTVALREGVTPEQYLTAHAETAEAFEVMAQALDTLVTANTPETTIPADVDYTPTVDLFERALSIGYDRDAAARVADCWENWDMVQDPCPIHPNHSLSTDHQGFHLLDCEACTVIVKSDAAGYQHPGAEARCQACRTAPATTTLQVRSKFIGAFGAPKSPSFLTCEPCFTAVMDSVPAGSDVTMVYVVWQSLDPEHNRTPAFLVLPRDTEYQAAEISDRARRVAWHASPFMHLPVAGYTVVDPATREPFDVSTDGCSSEVRELSPSEVISLRWENYTNRGFRCEPRLTVNLRLLINRIADAESRELFRVSPDGVTGPIHNRHFRHRIVRFEGSNCCERSAKYGPGHLHMSAVPSVISAYPGDPEVTIECRIGQKFNIDGREFTLVNERNGDPVLIPVVY